MGTYKRSKISLIIILSLATTFCSKKNNNDYSLLVALGLVQPLGDYWAKMYKFNPYIVNDPDNIYFIDIATPEQIDPIKKKLVIISGWNFNDRSNRSYPTIEELKKRVLNNWNHLIITNHFLILLQNYEIFTFDYLTSDPIDINGYRLRVWLDKLFIGYNKKVIIYAHSMGGLVSRFALYYNERPDYLKAIVTAGTPFHGSPWASPEYQKDKTVLGSLASFLTDSEGGKDLRWDNYDNSLTGASNLKLTTINQKIDRDDLLYTLYGEVLGGNNYASDSNQNFSSLCSLLNDFSSHDCIVPSRSAYIDGHVVANKQKIGSYDHIDINWQTPNVRNFLLNYLNNL